MKRIFHSSFNDTPGSATNVRKTFDEVRREQKSEPMKEVQILKLEQFERVGPPRAAARRA